MHSRFLLAGVVAGAMAIASAAGAAPPKQVTVVEGITEYSLDNGLRVLLFPDASKETFTLNVTYQVGSRHEGYGETGMAHLLEHMLFKGSPKHPKVWEELKTRGASNNASTWYDRTNYFETMPAKGDNLAWAIEMEADRMVNSSIAQTELAKEFSVVRNEFEINENDPSNVLLERIWSTAYLWHNYGKSTIGSRADIERVPAPTLRAFYKKYYRPDNAVVIVTGKFDAPAALKLVQQHFGAIPRPAAPLPPTYTQEPVQDGERFVTLRRNGDTQVVGLAYHIGAASDPDYPAAEALSDALTSEPSGRLYTALVKTGLASNVGAFSLVLHDPGILYIQATVPVGKSLDVVRDKLLQVVEGFAKQPITDEELGRFKAKQKKQWKLAFANSDAIGIALSEYIGAGDWRLLFIRRDRVAALTTAAVQKVATSQLIASNRTLGLFYPTKDPQRAPQKETPDIAKTVAGYTGSPAEQDGEKFEATIANIEKRTTRATLASGLKLATLFKTTRGHVVRAKLTLRYGTETDFTNQRLASSMIDDMLARGTKKHTFQQLKDAWDRLEATVSFASTPGVLDVTVQTTRDNLPEVLALVDEVLRQPAFPQDQFDIMIKEAVAGLEEQKSDPIQQAFTTTQRVIAAYPKSHPLYVPTIDEQIAGMKALRVGDLKRWPAMFGTSNATMTVVGEFDAAKVVPWIEKTWGGWKSPRPWKRLARTYFPTTANEIVLDFPDKANALVAVVHALDLRDDDPDAPALVTGNYALGAGGFISRLTTRLRQKEGYSYFAFSGATLLPLDATGTFLAAAAVNPENSKKGMAALLEEVNRFVASGITADELKAAKDGLLQAFDRNLSNDNFVLGQIHDGLFVGRTLEFWAKNNAAVKALTVDQVNAIAKKRLKPATLVKVIAGDKKKMPL